MGPGGGGDGHTERTFPIKRLYYENKNNIFFGCYTIPCSLLPGNLSIVLLLYFNLLSGSTFSLASKIVWC